MGSSRNYDIEDIVELLDTDDPLTDDQSIRRSVRALVDASFLLSNINEREDQEWFAGKPGLTLTDVNAQDDDLKRRVLFLFVHNPTVFILFNTQKGKSKLLFGRVREWVQTAELRVIPILLLDNDRTLGEQTIDGLPSNVELFRLMSGGGCSNSATIQQVCNYIDSFINYPGDKKKVPVVVALANVKQVAKVLEILVHVSNRHQAHRNIKFALAFDEADKTYPTIRKHVASCDGREVSIKQFIVDNVDALHETVFVTATEGTLLMGGFPECENAQAFITEIAPEDDEHYKAPHLPNARFMPTSIAKTNNDAFRCTLRDHWAHFTEPIELLGGAMGFPKTIINSNARCRDMTNLAVELAQQGFHAMVFNQEGVTVHRPGVEPVLFKTRQRRFSEVLFYAFKKLDLHTAPLFIIGRRKVDRGLSFHYAPRSHCDHRPREMSFEERGSLSTDGVEGLIWTDLVLGTVKIKETAVQKAGRLAGIIGQCPQYPMRGLTWWTDDETAHEVTRHYKTVDETNRQSGGRSIQDANDIAKVEIANASPMPNRTPTVSKGDDRIKYCIVNCGKIAMELHEGLYGAKFRKTKPVNGFYYTTTPEQKQHARVMTVSEVIATIPRTGGAKATEHKAHRGARRLMLCYDDPSNADSLRYVIIVHPDVIERAIELKRNDRLHTVLTQHSCLP